VSARARGALVAFALLFTTACAGAPSRVKGTVAPGVEEVRAELDRSFRERGERGAAVAVYLRGEKVVDLWGGEADDAHRPWLEDTMVPVFSTTKGLAALAVAVAHARGLLDYEAPVARYWPEFAANGKERVTVRQLLAHEAGLVLLDEELPFEVVRDLDATARILARQRPAWPPGARHGYHLSTLGLYMNELVRRVDPAHRSLGRFFADEIARPLGADVVIGAPPSLDPSRVARVELPTPAGGLAHLLDPPPEILVRLLSPSSAFTRSMAIPKGYDANDPRWWTVELPSGNGLGTARGIARVYGEFAAGGAAIGVGPATLARLEEAPRTPPDGDLDEVLGVDTHYGLGFAKPSRLPEWGSSDRAYGMFGAGGSFAFADPDTGVGYAYVMNRMGYCLDDDPREVALREAVARAVGRLAKR
jgi:CubicO group peptidase (beta-lactamase class C family)